MNSLSAPPEPKLSLAPDLHGDLEGMQELQQKLLSLPASTRFTDDQIETVYGIGYALYQQGKFESAVGLYQVLLIYRPMDARIMTAFAMCCKRLSRFDAAIPAFAAALALAPDDPSSAIHLSECLAALGKLDECRTILDPLIKLTELDEHYDSIRKRAETLRSLLNTAGARHGDVQ